MIDYTVEIRGADAENEALQLQQALSSTSDTAIVPAPPTRDLDPITMLMVTAAGLQSVDILVRFYQDWLRRQRPSPLSHPAMTIVLPDGTRIELAEKDPKALKRLLNK